MTSDSLRTDTTATVNASSAFERDAKVEQLLLAGLDHYFALQYEQAINIWTRALFFDRSHPRARAYIERARRAQAERQRESDELLHKGVVAYRRGDGREARRLLQAALDAGAPVEDTFPMLERLNQLDAAIPTPAAAGTRSLLQVSSGALLEPTRRRWHPLPALGVALVAMVGAVAYVIVSSRGEWKPWSSLSAGRAAPPAPITREMTFGVPTRGEVEVAGARRLISNGDLHGALSALERVRPTDPLKGEADRLRADVQRQLIRAASDGPPAVSGAEPGREPQR